jgi:poly(A) polymerase
VTDALFRLLAQPGVRTLFDALDGGGEEARIAGGAVRDALLGITPHEVDFATTATPDEVERRARAAGLRTVPTGIAHGTVTVIADGTPFEVTTLRRDVETDGRHAVVAFGRDWSEDAQRRDFTINGLYLDRQGTVHDAVGGQADLLACRVRFIGDARARIREDYLRILRFFRFFARFSGSAPDGEALRAAIAEREGLRRLSRERVRAELLKLLVARHAVGAVEIMADSGLLGLLLGGVPRVPRLRAIERIEAALARTPDPILRLGALALFVEEDADRLHSRLRLSNAEAERLAAMAGTRPELRPGMAAADLHRALYRLGADTVRDRLLLGWANAGTDDGWEDLLARAAGWPVPRPPFRAAEFLARGVGAGPGLGAALRRAEALWIEADFTENPAEIDAIIRGVADI